MEKKREKILFASMASLSFLTLWATLMTPILDGDIWFHLLYGKAIVEQHTLTPDHTVYSWTPSTNMNIYCTWIGQLFYYLLYTYFGGEVGIIFFRYIAASIPLFAIFYLARQKGVPYHPLAPLIATASILLLSISTLDKPDILSLLFMTILVVNWFQLKQIPKNYLIHTYLFPFIILLWVNTHGIFTFGCIFLLVLGIGETINQILYKKNALPVPVYRHLMYALILSFFCIFINPYGFDYIFDLIFDFFSEKNQKNLDFVMAWQKTFSIQNTRIVYTAYAVSIITCTVLFISWWKKKIDIATVLINIAFAYFFTFYTRLIYLWIPVFSLTSVYYLDKFNVKNIKYKKYAYIAFFSLNIAFCSLIIYWQYKYPAREGWPSFHASEIFTIEEEVDFIQTHYPKARLGTVYNHGAYILWKTWPKRQVMMDARYFPYKDWFQEYMKFDQGNEVDAFIQKYPFDLMEVSHFSQPLKAWFARSADWKPVFYGKGAIVYKRGPFTVAPTVQRGHSLASINNFATASLVAQTCLMIRDWTGYDQLISYIQNTFTKPEERDIASSMVLIKPGVLAYERGDYPAAISLLSLAATAGGYPPAFSAALLLQGITEWQQNNWETAIRHTMRSLFAQESVAATYNLALMAQEIEKKEQQRKKIESHFSEEEKKVLAQWRKALQQIIEKKDLPPRYKPFIDNARKILKDDPSADMQFMGVGWPI